MKFVSNKHVLVQFDKKYVPLLDQNGCISGDNKSPNDQTVIFAIDGSIVTQLEDIVQECLNQKVVGYSDQNYGEMYIATLEDTSDSQEQTMTLLKFYNDGTADIVHQIPHFID